MLTYLLQVILLNTFFIGFYDLFLRKEPYFQVNRFYLLSASVLGILLPLMKFSIWPTEIPLLGAYTLPEIPLEGRVTPHETSLSWSLVFWSLWAIGAIVSGYFFSKKLWMLYRFKQQGIVSKNINSTLVVVPQSTHAFSFLNHIFIGQELSPSQREPILLHEQVHVSQRHTWDLLWFESLKIIFWFNPIHYLFQDRISTVQEYYADAKVVQLMNKTDYYERLLNQYFHTEAISFINTFFNKSLIKKRIIMLQQSKSNKRFSMKYLFLLPTFLSLMFIAVACVNGEKENNTENNDASMVTTSGEAPKEMFFTEIDKVPTYPGCEDLEGDDAQKCFTQKIASFVVKEFNKNTAPEGVSGKERIIVDFTIDAEGKVRNVKAKSDFSELEIEAVRVASQLPQMIPGAHKGKPVSVKFTLPILFELDK